MADKGFIRPWLHWAWWPFSGFNNMFTQPLLFDDSLSLLQKVAMLWRKLHDLIEEYESFAGSFDTWKSQVESALSDLAAALEELQECCATMQAWKPGVDTDIEWLKDQIAEIMGDIAAIEGALDDLGDVTQLVNQVNTNTTNITDMSTDITQLEETVGGHTTTLTTLNTTVSQLGTDLTALTNRVSANEDDIDDIKDALEQLDVRLPLQLIDATNFDAVSTAWYNWIAGYCDDRSSHTPGTFAGIWTKTDDFHPGTSGEHSKPRKLLTVGKVGQSFTQAVLPLMISAQLSTPTTQANEAQVISEVMGLITSSGLDKLFTVGLQATQTSYFNFTMLDEYPYPNDNITFHTSYIMFNPEAWDGTKLSRMYRVSFDRAGNYTVCEANSINMDVRLHVDNGSDQGRLAVVGNELYFIVYNGYVVVCFHAQNA